MLGNTKILGGSAIADTHIISNKPLEEALLKIQRHSDNAHRIEQEKFISGVKQILMKDRLFLLQSYYNAGTSALVSLSPEERFELSQTIPQKAKKALAVTRMARNCWTAATVAASSLVPSGIYAMAKSLGIITANPGAILFIGSIIMVVVGTVATINLAKKALKLRIVTTIEWRYLQNLSYLQSHLPEAEMRELLSK